MKLVIGEILIDLIEQKPDTFYYSLGGAPFNFSSNLTKFCEDITFFGTVGNDFFGNYIINEVPSDKHLNICLDIKNDVNTTLAINAKNKEGERDYSFYRCNTSDYQINFNRLNEIDLNKFDYVHIGSLMPSKTEIQNDLDKFLMKCFLAKKIISLDINLRKDLYETDEEIIKTYFHYFNLIDILKFSEDEINFLTSSASYKDGLIKLRKMFFNKIFFVTLGPKGAVCMYQDKIFYAKGNKIKPIHTIGCGDSFFAGAIHALSKNKFNYSDDVLLNALKFGIICGEKTCKIKGALNAYKDENEILEGIKNTKFVTKIEKVKIN